ncbi:MAG: hypothetical protein OXH51_08365 [Gemmatimonadetes bacterium]|nr:hypothetical protein [Gemmatimonadota bacterium]MCY3611534.1 hypothetical protein [Gemmatimonadota bacterium]MCY3677532.1 hypothetical protein [Gemmatimonadota bacterium]MYA42989.1 hypothetical protein [Gemmatimonadota bacterium]MYE93286.1 hypothetical protein [Gemmatimonadota bacterium]
MTVSGNFRAAALLTLFALLTKAPVQGQSIPSPYRYIEYGQEASALWGTLHLSTGSLDLGPRTASFLGGRYVVEASGPLFIEGMLTYLPTVRDVIDPRRAEGDRSIGETDVHLFMLDARLGFSLTGRRTWNRISPHLFVGGGIAYDAAGLSALEEVLLPEDVFDFGTAFTASAGTGVKLAISSRLMLRADGSLKLWQLTTPSGFDDEAKQLDSIEQSEWASGYGFSVSLALRF